jgi:hypothetical protein
MIPWFDNMKDKDFSGLQFIRFISEIPDIYLPYLAGLAEIKKDAGLYYSGDFKEMSGLFKIFKPKYIVGPSLNLNDWELLKGMINMELMLVSIEDSVLNVPLPALPSLKQIFLTGIESDVILTNEFFVNNRQIEKVFIEKPGSFDFALLKPLDNLKELVINEADSIINFILINNQKNLELLSVTGNNLVYDAALIRLPSLRWIVFSSTTGQEEFNSIIDAHPGLEIIEIIENDKIDNLQPLSKLNKLFGLTITDTVTDIASIKTLKKLKYLSLPDKFLSDILNKTDIQRSLPDARIAANEGFCLGSGWLLLLIPLVLLIRFFAGMKKTSNKVG